MTVPAPRPARLALAAMATAAALTHDASAHLVSTELGPFYDGAAHPLVSPEDLLAIVGVAIVAAWRGPDGGRRALTALASCWALGAAAGFGVAAHEWASPVATAVALVILGVAGLGRVALPTGALLACGAIVGLGRGLANGSAAQLADGRWLTIAGIAAGVAVIASIAAATCVTIERRGGAIVLRVGGSWIAAIGLLLLGWTLRGAA